MPDVKLHNLLESNVAQRAERKHVVFAVNREGKVTCSCRDSEALGVGRTRLMAFLDWEEKVALNGKGAS